MGLKYFHKKTKAKHSLASAQLGTPQSFNIFSLLPMVNNTTNIIHYLGYKQVFNISFN
jgi:hypothetical protein